MASLISKESSIKYDTHLGVRKNSLNSNSENYDGLKSRYSTLGYSYITPRRDVSGLQSRARGREAPECE